MHNAWPPPDVDIRWRPPGFRDPLDPLSHGSSTETLFSARAVSPASLPDGTWWTTLGEFLAGISWPVTALIGRALSLYNSTMGSLVGSFLSWPIMYDSDRGETMRWIRHTLRGTLGGDVEQFQFKCDWGVPGADPDISEAEAGALAVTLATAFKTSWLDVSEIWHSTTNFVESGVVQLEQTDATNADGTGGNLSESFSTQWFMWPSGSRPVGTGSGGNLPYEVSPCVTLLTDHRGASGRGRIYLPPPIVTSMADGGVFNSSVGQFGYVIGGYFINGITATPYTPVVASRRRIIINEITSLQVGKVPDSQRRRRRSQDEARVTKWTLAGGLS